MTRKIFKNIAAALVCICFIYIAGKASASTADRTEVWLIADHHVYNPSAYGREYQITRDGNKVFLIVNTNKVFLGFLSSVDSNGHYQKEAPDVLIADLMFDGKPKFLIKSEQNFPVWNASYKIVDENGDDIFNKLFDETARNKLDEITNTNELSTPVINHVDRTLSYSKTISLHSNTRVFKFINGKYAVIIANDEIYFEKNDIAILKTTIYENDIPKFNLFYDKEEDDGGIRPIYVNIYINAKSKIDIFDDPRKKNVKYSMIENDMAKMIDFLRFYTPDGKNRAWIKILLDKNDISGWIEESNNFDVIPGVSKGVE